MKHDFFAGYYSRRFLVDEWSLFAFIILLNWNYSHPIICLQIYFALAAEIWKPTNFTAVRIPSTGSTPQYLIQLHSCGAIRLLGQVTCNKNKSNVNNLFNFTHISCSTSFYSINTLLVIFRKRKTQSSAFVSKWIAKSQIENNNHTLANIILLKSTINLVQLLLCILHVIFADVSITTMRITMDHPQTYNKCT